MSVSRGVGLSHSKWGVGCKSLGMERECQESGRVPVISIHTMIETLVFIPSFNASSLEWVASLPFHRRGSCNSVRLN